ncbi:calcium-binding protein [Stieleria varia]|uniref:Poly(Beta-D-mannuronate) C5 epimerase 6 n=1 Tax=Stieleria varia TaxID=2528005 RepID=A0A5C6BA19_9BACT|nr:calcium-binding protein [Stieleria varia]TWU08567.1 Poly(beta-D-mannuronate) C5 epimerase 6 [Stieleria varia]
MRYFKTLAAALLTTACLIGSASAGGPDYDIDDHCDPLNGYVQLILDDSHDLIYISRDDDKLDIRGLMFDSNVFDDVPDPFVFDEEELENLADKDFHYRNGFDDVQRVIILCRDGNDVVITDNDVPVIIFAFGEDGNDILQGSMMDDGLQGGLGEDVLSGKDGNDVLNGGFDGERDRLQGGLGVDTFIQFYELETITQVVQPVFQRITLDIRNFNRFISNRRPTIQTTTTTVRHDEEILVDFEPNEDILNETEI